MKNLQKILLISILLICGALAGCGRYSEPEPIEGSGYPHSYPQH